MFVKVCGMKHPHQIAELDELVTFIGFIFYEKSPRYVEETSALKHANKVGVFVNADLAELLNQVKKHSLDYVQLHGNESPEYCTAVQPYARIIKAFGVRTTEDFAQTISYANVVDYFLFDTKTPSYGGSGKKFDWTHLQAYSGKTPFLLSGGIQPDSIDALLEINHPQLVGVDLNSGFEVDP
ncbi:MAG: phosphoribosylanthranilate isomerase, partial [Crocinitomicaceae bacterium]